MLAAVIDLQVSAPIPVGVSTWSVEMELKATSNDRVIFTSLKPMSEINLCVPVLFYDANGQPYLGIFFDADHVICDGVVYGSKKFIGWRHVPKVDELYFTEEEISRGKEMAKMIAEYENGKSE